MLAPETLERLRKAEQELGIEPDMSVDTLMEACSQEGKTSIATDFLLRMLGLDICADTLVSIGQQAAGTLKVRLKLGGW